MKFDNKDNYIILDGSSISNFNLDYDFDDTDKMVESFLLFSEYLKKETLDYDYVDGIKIDLDFILIGKEKVLDEIKNLALEVNSLSQPELYFNELERIYQKAFENGDILNNYVFCNIFFGELNTPFEDSLAYSTNCEGIVNLDKFVSILQKQGYELFKYMSYGKQKISYNNIFENSYNEEDDYAHCIILLQKEKLNDENHIYRYLYRNS